MIQEQRASGMHDSTHQMVIGGVYFHPHLKYLAAVILLSACFAFFVASLLGRIVLPAHSESTSTIDLSSELTPQIHSLQGDADAAAARALIANLRCQREGYQAWVARGTDYLDAARRAAKSSSLAEECSAQSGLSQSPQGQPMLPHRTDTMVPQQMVNQNPPSQPQMLNCSELERKKWLDGRKNQPTAAETDAMNRSIAVLCTAGR